MYDDLGRTRYQSYPFDGVGVGVGTTFDYDVLGRVTFETSPDGVREHRYSADAVTVFDENAHATTYTYKPFGHPDDALLVGIRDADQKDWLYEYDGIGALTKVTGPPLDGQPVVRTWAYNDQHLVANETHPESGTTTYTDYDAAGVLKAKRDAIGNVVSYGYDDNDRLRSIQSGSSLTTIDYEPNADNRSLTVVDGQSSAFAYDTAGRLKSRTDTIDGKAFVTKYEYDWNDNLTAIEYPSLRRVEIRYDNDNRVKTVLTPSRREFYAKQFEYHPSGAVSGFLVGNNIPTIIGYSERYRVESIQSGALGLTYPSYDGVGNVVAVQDSRASQNQSFAYDTLDRLTLATGPWGSATYSYDAHGNRLTAGSITYAYEPNNKFRLTSDGSFNLTYDDNGNVRSASAATYTYSPENRLMRSDTPSGTTTFAYDADDWRLKKAITNGETHYYVRGPGGELLSDWWNNGPGGQAEVRDYIYAGAHLIAVVKTTQASK
jgi:YD repeat-containing protein